MDAPVARLIHIHELAALPSCSIHILQTISGCPVWYGVSYKNTLGLIPLRVTRPFAQSTAINIA